MKRGQLAILLFAALAVGLIAFSGGGGDDDGKGGGSSTRESGDAPPAGAMRISFPYSPEKKPLMEPLIQRFNASRTEVAGKAVFEVATRCRQGGVPCYVVAGNDLLDAFERRLLNVEVEAAARDGVTARPEQVERAARRLARRLTT